MSRFFPGLFFFLVAFVSVAHAEPSVAVSTPVPTLSALRQTALYQHNKEWLKSFPASFVAANIRGEGFQYAERRAAALDLAHDQRDFSVVSELVGAVERDSFLSIDIIDVLEDWKAKRAIAPLEKIAGDEKRDPALRQRAKKAAEAIRGFTPAPPPKF